MSLSTGETGQDVCNVDDKLWPRIKSLVSVYLNKTFKSSGKEKNIRFQDPGDAFFLI